MRGRGLLIIRVVDVGLGGWGDYIECILYVLHEIIGDCCATECL